MKLWAVSETAKQFGVSTFTIRRLIRSGQIRAVNVGARILVPSTEVERVVTEGCGKRRVRKTSPEQGGGA
jgi:excisionase family DNA binding protein